MKRSLPDVLRRGLDSTIANWPVIVLRIAESILLIGIVIASIIVAIVPAIVAAGLSKDEIINSSDPPAAIVEWLIGHLMLFVWMFALAFIVLGVLLAIHAFVEGGAAQIYVDARAEREAASGAGRDAFRAFSVDRWLAGGAASWWRIFWLYNWAWSVGLLFVLVPLMLTIVGLMLISDTVGRVVVGCVDWRSRSSSSSRSRSSSRSGARKRSRSAWPARCRRASRFALAWRAVRDDLGRHVAVAVIAFVVSMALNSIVSAFSVPMTISSAPFAVAGVVLHARAARRPASFKA